MINKTISSNLATSLLLDNTTKFLRKLAKRDPSWLIIVNNHAKIQNDYTLKPKKNLLSPELPLPCR